MTAELEFILPVIAPGKRLAEDSRTAAWMHHDFMGPKRQSVDEIVQIAFRHVPAVDHAPEKVRRRKVQAPDRGHGFLRQVGQAVAAGNAHGIGRQYLIGIGFPGDAQAVDTVLHHQRLDDGPDLRQDVQVLVAVQVVDGKARGHDFFHLASSSR